MINWLIPVLTLLECAILARIMWDRVALPAFAAFLCADILFTAAMQGLAACGSSWLTTDYQIWYNASAPGILGLLVAATVESIGPLPRESAGGIVVLVICAMGSSTTPAVTRCAIMGACALALTVALAIQSSKHSGLMLAFIAAPLVESLSILLGETNSTRPATFLVLAQLAPLTGWLLWTDRLAEPERALRQQRS